MTVAEPGTRGGEEFPEEGEYGGRDLESMAGAKNYYAWIIDEFAPYLGAKGAEVGAGSGTFSEILASTGLSHLTSFEPSPNMYALLEKRFQGRARVETRQAYVEDVAHLYPGAFDSVTYVNVLEHVRDDLRELRIAGGMLAPGGHLLLFVPAHQLLYSPFDRECGHYRRYNKKDLSEIVERSGLSIRTVKYFDVPGAFAWFLMFVLLRRTLTGGSVRAYDRLVVPLARKTEKIVPPPFGKNLLLVARKK